LVEQVKKLSADIDAFKMTKADAEKQLIESQAKVKQYETELATLKSNAATSKQANTSGNKDLANFLEQLKQMATNISTGKDYSVPVGLNTEVTAAFSELYKRIKEQTQSKVTPVKESFSNITCFLNYFVSFFMKALFTSASNKEERALLFRDYSAVVDTIFTEVKKEYSNKDDEQILKKILSIIFELIKSSETFFLNRKTPLGVETDKNDIGINVIVSKLITADFNTIFNKIYDITKTTPIMNSQILEESLYRELSLSQPGVFFNKPVKTSEGVLSEDGKQLTLFPSFTYLPDDIITDDLKTRFQIINTDNVFSKKLVQLKSIVGDSSSESVKNVWEGKMNELLKDKTLKYSYLFIIFILFGRKYLLQVKTKDGCSTQFNTTN
jgi:hypothetical protein